MRIPGKDSLQRRFLAKIGSVLALAGGAIFWLEIHIDQETLNEAALGRARAHARESIAMMALETTHTPKHNVSATNAGAGEYTGHIVRRDAATPGDTTDAWERTALEALQAGASEHFGAHRDGDRVEFRYLAPVPGEAGAGISVRFDLSPLVEQAEFEHRLKAGVVLFLCFALLWVARNFARRLDRQMERLARRHEELVESVEGIVWEAEAADLRFTFVSRRAEHLLGYPLSDWLEPGFWAAHVHPDDKAWVSEYFANCAQQRKPLELEYRFLAQDGRVIWLHDSISPVVEEGQPLRLRGLMLDLTSRRQQEDLVQLFLAEKETIINNVLVAILYVQHRRIVSCNRRLEEIFGYRTGDLIGESTERLYATREDYETIGQRAYTALEAGESYTEELLLRRKDGSIFWGALNGRAIDSSRPHEGSIWIYADISERRRAAEEAQKLLQAVEQSPVSIVITDPRGCIEYVNPRFTEVTGYAPDEIIGRSPSLLKSGETPPAAYEDLWQTVLGGKTWRGTLLNRCKDGRLIWEDISISPIFDVRGQITHLLGVKEDISERKRIEEELERYQLHLEEEVAQRTADLAAALEAAKVADRAKDAFLANVSHELRTPLNAVIGLSALAVRTSQDPQQRETLQKVTDSGQTLLGIINDLLDLSKIAAGEMRFEKTTFSLRRVVARIGSMMSHKAQEKGLRLSENVDERVPDVLVGDPLRVEQILLNLTNNAIKFTERGEVTVEIAAEPLDDARVRLLVEVTDSGIGMSDEQIAQLFRPFVQADASITRKHGGTGLGLVICKQLAEGMDGDVRVSSRPGEGSTFHVRLCLGLGQAGDLPLDDAGDAEKDMTKKYPGARVLLVDDQPLNQEVVCELLSTVGIAPAVANNGQEALDQIFAAGPEGFDLVLMDIQMPVMDGLSATQQIRARAEFARLPIVAMTAHTMEHEKTIYLAAGMNDHLGKPFQLTSFFRLLARWLAPHSHEATPSASPGAVPAAPAAALPTIEGLDTRAALERFLGNEARYRHWLAVFVEEAAGFTDEIAERLADGRQDEARTHAHAFKGRTGMLGMTTIHALAAALETAVRDGHACDDLLAQLASAIAAMRDQLRAAGFDTDPMAEPETRTTAETSAGSGARTAPTGPLPASIAQLLTMLEAGDGGSAAAINACTAELHDTHWPPLLCQALAAVRQFDFDTARRVLDPASADRAPAPVGEAQ